MLPKIEKLELIIDEHV